MKNKKIGESKNREGEIYKKGRVEEKHKERREGEQRTINNRSNQETEKRGGAYSAM